MGLQKTSKKTLPPKFQPATVDQEAASVAYLQNLLAESQVQNQALQETIMSLKNRQQELVDENEKLIRVNNDLDDFVYTVSHDLLGPLGNIEASVSGIHRRSAKSDFKIYLQVIDSSVKKCSKLIKNLATIARMEGDMAELAWVDLNEVIAHIKLTLRDKLKAAAATIITDFAVDKLLFSEKNLRGILYNLISNGIQFKGIEPPVIRIKSEKSGDFTVLTIQDNGKGISASALGKVFKMYGRLNHDLKDSSIGLYLAKKMVNSSGGQIQVMSEEGKGSTFILRFQNNQQKEAG